MDVQTIYSSQLYRSRWIFSPAGLAWRMEGGRAGVIDAEREMITGICLRTTTDIEL